MGAPAVWCGLLAAVAVLVWPIRRMSHGRGSAAGPGRRGRDDDALVGAGPGDGGAGPGDGGDGGVGATAAEVADALTLLALTLRSGRGAVESL